MPVTVRTARNIFEANEPTEREEFTVPFSGGTVADYAPPGDWQYASLNGRYLKDVSSRRPVDGDQLLFAELPGGVLSLVWAIWSIVELIGVTNVIVLALSTAASILLAPEPPDSPRQLAPIRHHGWGGLESAAQSGTPIPKSYGTHPVAGVIIQLARWTPTNVPGFSADGERLSLKVAFGHGEMSEITDFRVNDNAIENYTESTFIQKRLGTLDQGPIEGAAVLDGSQNSVELGNLPLTKEEGETVGATRFATTTQEVDRLRLNIFHPRGLGWGTPLLWPWTVEFEARHRLVGSGTWSDWELFTINSHTPFPFRSTVEFVDEPLPQKGQYDIEVRKVTPYDPPPFTNRETTIEWQGFVEVINDTFTHPGLAYAAILIEATEDLRGIVPKITALCTTKVLSHDGVTWVDDPAEYDNPAWILWDMLTNDVYGAAMDPAQLDLSSFQGWAAFCNEPVWDGTPGGATTEKRATFNGVFEGNESFFSSTRRVLMVGRATLIPRGRTLRVHWERARSPVDGIGMSEIVDGSWRESMTSTSVLRRSTSIEIAFKDAALNYDNNWAPAEDPEAVERGRQQQPREIEMFGVTRLSHAMREAQYHLHLSRQNHTAAFRIGPRGLLAEAGDVISVSHDVSQYGYSGSVRAATANTITLDRNVLVEPGLTYEIEIVTLDGPETRRVAMSPGLYAYDTAITLDADWDRTPDVGDRYAFGEVSRASKPWIITAIRQQPDLTREVELLAYDERVHDDTIVDLDPAHYTDLPDPAAMPPCLPSGPGLVEGFGGGGSSYVIVSWEYLVEFAGQVQKARVYRRDVTDIPNPPWNLVGEVPYPQVTHIQSTPQPEQDRTYEYVVVQVSPLGAGLRPDGCPSSSITMAGLTTIPDRVTGVLRGQYITDMRVEWQPVTNVAIAHYEVRRGASWVGSTLLGTTPATFLDGIQDFSVTAGGGGPGIDRIHVRAKSIHGLYGNAGHVDYTIDNWRSGAQLHRDEAGLGFPGTKTGVQVASGLLELTDPATPGTYESASWDLGTLALRRIGAVLWWTQVGGTWNGSQVSWNSGAAQRYSFEGVIDPALWPSSIVAEVRAADTTGNLAITPYVPLTTRDWANVRYVQFRLSLSTSDSAWEPKVAELYLTTEEP